MKKISKMMTMPGDGQSCSAWPPLSQQVIEMRERYGDATRFLSVFDPALQTLAAREWVRAYVGTAPTLACVVAGYGEKTGLLWGCHQLEDINLFAGVKEKMSVPKQKELVRLILTEYSYLKVTELLLFFYRLKLGQYGRFFGSVDALFISTALLTFIDQRRRDRARIDEWRQRQEEQNRQPASGGITYQEYLRRKQAKLDNQNNPNDETCQTDCEDAG